MARFFYYEYWICVFMESHILSIPKQISLLVEPILEELCFELVDVEYLTNYGRWILRIYIDKEGGVTLDDCAMVSREIGAMIGSRARVHSKSILKPGEIIYADS